MKKTSEVSSTDDAVPSPLGAESSGSEYKCSDVKLTKKCSSTVKKALSLVSTTLIDTKGDIRLHTAGAAKSDCKFLSKSYRLFKFCSTFELKAGPPTSSDDFKHQRVQFTLSSPEEYQFGTSNSIPPPQAVTVESKSPTTSVTSDGSSEVQVSTLRYNPEK